MTDSERETGRKTGEKETVSIIKCSHVRHPVFLHQHLEHHFNHLAQLVEVKLARTTCPMTSQHLHASHVYDEKRVAIQSTIP